MVGRVSEGEIDADRESSPRRGVRADARRNMATLLDAALAVFARSGVDAPVREVATAAGVGVGTVYRHFPRRSDLIVAVFRHEVDECADAAPELAAAHTPGEALSRWMGRYVDFIAAKRGLAAALRSGDPAFEALPGYFEKKLVPVLRSLLDAAALAGEARGDIEPYDLLRAVGDLGMSAHYDGPGHARRMVALLVDGLRFGASQ